MQSQHLQKMNKIIIAKKTRVWRPIEYYIKDVTTKEIILYAVHNWGWKGGIDVCQIVGKTKAKRFSIKASNLFTFTYNITNLENKVIGTLVLENWSSQSWQVTDNESGAKAYITTAHSSIDEKYRLTLRGQDICVFTEGEFSNSSLYLHCMDDAKLNINLIFSVGIILLAQKSGGIIAGAG